MQTDQPLSFAARLRQYRGAAGLTQEALAERAGISARAVSDLERGAGRLPRLTTLQLLATALSLSPEERAALLAAAQPVAPVPTSETPSPPAALPAEASSSAPTAPMERADLILPPPPSWLTPLLGREHEEAEIATLLRRHALRLLTLTGPGGVGKTRLAAQVAHGALPAFPGGVAFIALAEVRDVQAVLPALAQALGLRDDRARPATQVLIEGLPSYPILLVLDNLEQVIGVGPALLSLLAACPTLHLLLTSRAPLRVQGEQEYAVSTLALPDAARPIDREEVVQCAAVQLFVQRAKAIEPHFQLTTANAAIVAAICRRLDGLPLAIELATARIKLLPPAALLTRLERSLPLLAGGGPDRPRRQQTLHQTIAWSHDLLSVEAQGLFRRLAVFAGGALLEAIEGIGGDSRQTDSDVFDPLAELVGQSLLRVDSPEDSEPRYRLLETIREYAGKQLTISGEADVVRERHARYYLALAEVAEPELTGSGQEAWLARLQAEHDNLRAALAWTVSQGLAGMGLRLAGALWRFWYTRGYSGEGRAWYERLLAQEPRDTSEDAGRWRAKALVGAAGLAFRQGDFMSATPLAEEGLSLYDALDDLSGRANALTVLALLVHEQGDLHRARGIQEDVLALRRALQLPHGIAAALHNLAVLCDDMGDYARAGVLYEESLAFSGIQGSSAERANTLNSLGMVAWMLGDLVRAEALCRESLDMARQLGAKSIIAYALTGLGTVALTQGRYDDADRVLQESLSLRREVGDTIGVAGANINLGNVARRRGCYAAADHHYRASLAIYQQHPGRINDMAECLQGLAEVLWAQGQTTYAAYLLGGAAALYAGGNGEVPAPEQRQDYERVTALVREGLGAAAFAAALEIGRAMPPLEALTWHPDPPA